MANCCFEKMPHIQLMHGLAQYNRRLHTDHFLNRPSPNEKTFERLYNRLRETGSSKPVVQDHGRLPTTRTLPIVYNEKSILFYLSILKRHIIQWKKQCERGDEWFRNTCKIAKTKNDDNKEDNVQCKNKEREIINFYTKNSPSTRRPTFNTTL